MGGGKPPRGGRSALLGGGRGPDPWGGAKGAAPGRCQFMSCVQPVYIFCFCISVCFV